MSDENDNGKLVQKDRFLKLIQRSRITREKNAKERADYRAELQAAETAIPSFDKAAFNMAKQFDMQDVGKRERLWRNLKIYVEEHMGIGGQGDLEDAIAQALETDTRTDLERAMDGEAQNPVDAVLDGEADDGTAVNGDMGKIARFRAAIAQADTLDAVRLGYNRFLDDNKPASSVLKDAVVVEARRRLVALGEDADIIPMPRKRRGSAATAQAAIH